MRLAVIVPAYNAAHVIPKTVPAMLAQREPARWVFVDDGSGDGTTALLQAEIGRAHLAPDVSAEVLTLSQNRGRAGARNAGLAAVEGADVVVMLDVDAAPEPDFLAAHRAAYASGALAAMSRLHYADVDLDEPYGRYLASSVRGPGAARGGSAPLPWRYFLTGACSVRASALRDVGGFDASITYGEDLDLAARLAAQQPDGLRLAGTVRLFDHRTLGGALCILREFGGENLPRMAWRNPDVLRVGRLAPVTSRAWRYRMLRAVLRPAGAAARVMLPVLPGAVQARAVRLVLASTLAAAYQSGRRRLDATP